MTFGHFSKMFGTKTMGFQLKSTESGKVEFQVPEAHWNVDVENDD